MLRKWVHWHDTAMQMVVMMLGHSVVAVEELIPLEAPSCLKALLPPLPPETN